MNDTHDASESVDPPPPIRQLSDTERYLILAAAFLGWMLAGSQLGITSLAMRPAATELLGVVAQDGVPLSADDDGLVAQWFGWLTAAFLSGAAAGGFVFGRIGDQFGRTRAMALAILCYSVFSGIAYFAAGPWDFLVLRFLVGLGVGGMWPNGVALVSEAWSNLSRPMLAGVMGTSANVGIFITAQIAKWGEITPDHWRWVMLVGAAPIVLALLVLALVAESPRWLASRQTAKTSDAKPSSHSEIFRPPLLATTMVGIALATIPLIGGWGSANWIMSWADQVVQEEKGDSEDNQVVAPKGESAQRVDNQSVATDPQLKAHLSAARSFTGVIGSLLGGWLASLLGRRRCYLLISVFALATSQYIFWFLVPGERTFLIWFAALGFFSGVYFGWLPLCLPEMFPTRVRSTGAGVSFNFGRILTVVTRLTTSMLIAAFGSNYAVIGRITSLVYAVGIVVIIFAPDTTAKTMDD